MGKLKGCLVFVATPIVLLILLAGCIGSSVSKTTPDVTTTVSETPAPPKVEAPPAVQEPAPVVVPPAPPAPVVAPPAPVAKDVTYANCAAVRAAGAAPIHRGDPGYNSKLDKDGDGIACE